MYKGGDYDIEGRETVHASQETKLFQFYVACVSVQRLPSHRRELWEPSV